MATASPTVPIPVANVHRLGVLRLALTGALGAAIFFALCWTGAAIGFRGAPHMYLQLFTLADPSSGLALIEGVCWSLAFGLVAGALLAFLYNLLASLDRG